MVAATVHDDVAGRVSAPTLAAWAVFCAASNALPVPAVRNVYLSMSGPVNIAVAVLFAPGIAAVVVAASSISEWEIRGETTFLHAVYNRAQLGMATAAAAAIFAATGGATPTIAGSIAAVAAYQLTNWILVAAAELACRRVPVTRVLRGLVPQVPVAAVSYFALGLMGVALAVTYDRVGAWAVALLMLPLLGARHAVAASRQLEQAERTQRALAGRLIDERERERVRIAADIHDVVLQELAALQLVSENVGSAIRTGRLELAERLAQQLGEGTRQAVVSLRRSIASLRRATFDEAGVAATLARHVRSFSVQSGVDVNREAEGVEGIPLPVGLLLYECSQEALTNVARHARAERAWVELHTIGGAVELRVADDGVGPDDAPGADEARTGSGLALLREKVALSGGSVTWGRRPEGGTELRVRVPLWAER